jgi:4-hydroxy-tetrahydrodipicolinate synthase
MVGAVSSASASFQGSMVALVTPMHPDGALDLAAYRALIDWHIEEKTDVLVVVGTSGESPTVKVDEHVELIEIAVQHVAGRIPVIVGVGANSTHEAIELAKHAHRAGAAAGLTVVPYYNRPTQEGLYRHFKAIAEAVTDLPFVLYNVPGRCVADISIETTLRLAAVSNIIGIKDATGDIGRGALLLHELAAACPDFEVYSGDDPTAAALMLLGARGNISVTANVAPRLMHDLCAAALIGDAALVRELNYKLARLNRALFVESNPIPVKWALTQLRNTPSGLRLPLLELSRAHHDIVRSALRDAGLL